MTQGLDLDDVRTRLTQWFKSKMPGARDLALSGLDRPKGGLSNETYSLELRWKEAGVDWRQKLVIRWVPPRFPLYPRYDIKEQFLVFKHLHAAGIPVPKALWLEEDPSVIGHQFCIVEHVEGWIPPDNPPYHVAGPLFDSTPERRARIWNQTVEVMAKIHTLDWHRAAMEFLGVPKTGTDAIDQHIAYFEWMMSTATPPTDPVLDAAKEWLKKNVPIPRYVSLCWGDARLGNVICQDDNVVVVLDWETAMLADAEADLAWMLHVDWYMGEGYGLPRLEGLPGPDETVAYYEKLTGRKVENLFYHDVFATWRQGVIHHKEEPTLKAMGYIPPDFPGINAANYEKIRRLLRLSE